MQRVWEGGFLRQSFFGDVFTVSWLEEVQAQGVKLGLHSSRCEQALPDFPFALHGPVNTMAARASGTDCRNCQIFPHQVRFAGYRYGYAEAIQERRSCGTFNPETESPVCLIIQCDVIRNDVVIDVFHHGLSCFGLKIEQKRIREAKDVSIRQDAALSSQEERVGSLARLQLLDVIGGKRMNQTRAVFTRGADPSMGGEIQKVGIFYAHYT